MHRLAIFSVLLLVSCESSYRVSGTVTVSRALQMEFSEAQSGLVIVEVKIRTQGINPNLVGRLCGGTPSEPAVFQMLFVGLGCAKPGTVTTWIERLAPGTNELAPGFPLPPCGSVDLVYPRPQPSDQRVRIGSASAAVFANNGGNCPSDDEAVHLVLEK